MIHIHSITAELLHRRLLTLLKDEFQIKNDLRFAEESATINVAGTVYLPDGRLAQVHLTIETEENNFLENEQD